MRIRSFAQNAAVVFFFVGTWLYAQSGDLTLFDSPLTYVNRPRYDAICAELASHPVIKGTFEQAKTLKSMNRTLVSGGNFIISAEMGMVWETLKPFPSTMAVGRDYLVQTMPRSGRKTKMDAKGNETFIRLADTLSAMFSGDAKKLDDNFDIFFTTDSRGWHIGLVPKEKAVRVFADKIILQGLDSIDAITLFEQNGNSIQYRLSNHTYPAALTADEKAMFQED